MPNLREAIFAAFLYHDIEPEVFSTKLDEAIEYLGQDKLSFIMEEAPQLMYGVISDDYKASKGGNIPLFLADMFKDYVVYVLKESLKMEIQDQDDYCACLDPPEDDIRRAPIENITESRNLYYAKISQHL